MNYEKYPWLIDDHLSSPEASRAIEEARRSYQSSGAAIFPSILTEDALKSCIDDARAQEDGAFTTDDVHTAYLRPVDPAVSPRSVMNFEMKTQVASIACDELGKESKLADFYRQPALRELVARVVGKDQVFLSDDPLGCCSVNVFRPGYHHSFHFDESEFSTTLMLQEASDRSSGLFQYTNPLRDAPEDLALGSVARAIHEYDPVAQDPFNEQIYDNTTTGTTKNDKNGAPAPPAPPPLHTLDFKAGTLSIFAGSKSLHRVTQVQGDCSRLVAVLTFASVPGFRNSVAVQKLFWGRSSVP